MFWIDLFRQFLTFNINLQPFICSLRTDFEKKQPYSTFVISAASFKILTDITFLHAREPLFYSHFTVLYIFSFAPVGFLPPHTHVHAHTHWLGWPSNIQVLCYLHGHKLSQSLNTPFLITVFEMLFWKTQIAPTHWNSNHCFFNRIILFSPWFF